MLPPADHSQHAGTRAGPACPCALKPLPCLVDTWVTGNSVPYEQPLSIQTDMEYTLDTRLFPGWDPVTGQTQPALVIDTAVLSARNQAAAAATATVSLPALSSMAGPCPPLTRTRAAAAAGGLNQSMHRTEVPVQQQQLSSQHQQPAVPLQTRTRYRHEMRSAAAALHASRTPATPAELPPAPAASYHPAFRPTESHFRPTPPQFLQHRPRQQAEAITALPHTNVDTDLLALIASIDVEPQGYQLDVDWLIGHPHLQHHRQLQQQQQQQQQHQHLQLHHQAVPPASATDYSATQRAAVAQQQQQHLHHQHATLHQRAVTRQAAAPPGAIQQQQQQQTTFTPNLSDYQSHFYPGATWSRTLANTNSNNGGLSISGMTITSGQTPMSQLGNFLQTRTASAVVATTAMKPFVVVSGSGKSRSTKRRLPVDSPCEGSVPVAFIDLTQSPKRARWTGGWTSAYGQSGLGVSHVPSPLQNRAY